MHHFVNLTEQVLKIKCIPCSVNIQRIFFFHFFYDLSLLQKFTYYSANDKKVLSESASFKNVPVPWAENLEVTLLAFGNPFHTGTPADMTLKVASSAILFQTVCLMSQLEILLVFYIQSLVCLLPSSVFQPWVAFLNLACRVHVAQLSRVSGWENEIFMPKSQCLLWYLMQMDPENLESGQQFIFLICLFLHKKNGRKKIKNP